MDTNTSAPRPRKKWLRITLLSVGGAAVALGGLVALAPTLVSAGLGKGFLESKAGQAVHGTARIGSLSLAWFGPQRITALELADATGQSQVRLDLGVDNGLFQLAFGSVDTLRAQVSGSVQAHLLPGGGTSLSNFAPSQPSAAPKLLDASTSASADPLAALPFPVQLRIGSLDATLLNGQATAFAVRGLKGQVAVGRAQPLIVDLTADTQVGERSGSLAVKGTLSDFLDSKGAPDPAGITGELDVQVTGWLAALSGLNAEIQSAAVKVQAPAGRPLGVAVNAAVSVQGGATSVQAQVSAARPQTGRALMAWATDPRTFTGQIALKGVPSVALQRFVAGTPVVLARDLGESFDASVRTGDGAGVNLAVTAPRLQLAARATVDTGTGAMTGDGISLQASLDPQLLAAVGTQVDAPVQVAAALTSLRTPAIPAGGSLDLSAVSFEGSLEVQPFQMLQVAPQPIAVGALAITVRAAPLGSELDVGVQGSVQQAPIDAQAQVTGLGKGLAFGVAQVRGTVAAGPLDPSVLPGLPPAARLWVDRVAPGATTLRASVAGTVGQGTAQAQLDMVPGSVAFKAAWDPQAVRVDQAQGTLTVQPALLSAVAGDAVALAGPMPVQWSAGPVRVERSGVSAFDPVPVSVQVPSLALSKVPGLSGSLSARDLSLQGSVDPDGPTLFDGTVTLASALAPVVDGVGSVQVRALSVQAKLPSGLKQVDVSVTAQDVTCPRVPSLSAALGVRQLAATLRGPVDFGPGASATFKATLHDAQADIAELQGAFEPQPAGAWKASLQSGEVDVRRALALMGQGEALPEWVGGGGSSHTLAVAAAGNAAGVSFSVNAALDPITLKAQGTRATDGSLTLTKGDAQARLPAGVVRSLLQRMGTPVTQCDPMQVSVTVNALKLPADAQGRLQPFVPGSDIDLMARIAPWKLQTTSSPTLAFGANELVVKSRAGTAAMARLTGSLGAEGTPAAPLSVSVQTEKLLDAQGHLALGEGGLQVNANVKDFPTELADRLSGMDGYLVDMLGPSFTLTLDGQSGSAPDEFFKATFTSPTLLVNAPALRLADRTLRIASEAPLTAELRPDDRFRQRILRPVNPFLADLRTTENRPIRATVSMLRMPLPVDMPGVDAAFTVDVGEVEIQKSSQFLGLMDLVKVSQGSTVPGLVSPLNGSITGGVLAYRDFKVQVGRLGKAGWQQTLFSDARIDLRGSPAVAEPITIRYPASSVTNLLAKIPGMQGVLGKLNNLLGSANQTIQQAAQVKVTFTGPLDGSELHTKVSPEIEMPKGVGNTLEGIGQGLEKGIGNALGDLFGGKKGN